MKLLALGCLHGKVPMPLRARVKEVDAILYCGDIVNSNALRRNEFDAWKGGKALSEKEYKKMVKNAVKSSQTVCNFFINFQKPVFFVWGNSDYTEADLRRLSIRVKSIEKRLPKNVKILENDIVAFGNIYIAGFSGYRGYMMKHGKYVKETKKFESRLRRLFTKIKYPRKTLFITHDVPYKKFDIVKLKESPAFGKHVGEPLFNKELRHKPIAAMICSHMHEYQGLDKLYKTFIVSAGYGRVGRAVRLTINNKIEKIDFFR